ncbi:hypothetical protein TNCV_3507561 [Trichonephila clavipes]|uniref:Uncharacterized protein n=1 Tax=Trichonephila clavipes TaxID=2585209 RepID=A0A8X6RY68_TRICX|nr:hypothetical protein TNCV_3507561 [Trichonephila clavipes]
MDLEQGEENGTLVNCLNEKFVPVEILNAELCAISRPLRDVRSNMWDVLLTVPNDPRYARLKTHLGIGQAKDG